MKPLIIATLGFILLTAFGYSDGLTKTVTLRCILTSGKTKYRIGELPALKVEIINNSSEDIYLIGSLDGSDVKWRMPYCYFTLQKPAPDTVRVGPRCGTLNPLRKEDFVLIKAGEKFNPYQNLDRYGFFSDYTVTNTETFKNAGVYKIQFHYSTNSADIAKFLGPLFKADKTDSLNLSSLFNRVPKVDLVSNEMEIAFEN